MGPTPPAQEEREIGWAVMQMRKGGHVTRSGWNGKGQYLGIQVPDSSSMNTLPYIYIITVNGKRVPWLASQTDILAYDWEVVDVAVQASPGGITK